MQTEDILDKFGAPIFCRIEEIKKKCQKSNSSYLLDFMGQLRDLPVIEFRVEFPIYRLANCRTISLQEEFLSLNPDKPSNFFERDRESVEAQIVQHDLLYTLAKDENLFDTFKEGIKQDEPLISTFDGIIVNGNRRLCAWRELYYNEPEIYKYFETVRAVILPECDEKAIRDLEARLQIKKDIKAAYKWHAIANMIKYLKSIGTTEESIANSYDMSIPKIRELLEMRDYAEIYLEQRGIPKQWSKVGDEYAFREFVKNRKKVDDPIEKELFESVSFAFIDNSEKAGGRIYDIIPEVRESLSKIKDAITERLDVAETENKNDDTSILTDNIDNESLEESKIVATASKIENSETVMKIAKNVIESQRSIKEDQKSAEYLINQVRKANTILINAASIGLAREDISTNGLEEQLDSIEINVKRIREWLLKKNVSSN